MDAYQDFRWNDSIWLLSNYLFNMFVALLMYHLRIFLVVVLCCFS